MNSIPLQRKSQIKTENVYQGYKATRINKLLNVKEIKYVYNIFVEKII